ncbi:MAG: WGR domain-containing protein [Candidatus Lokiarchaeota archaeon]|nr:WGR domain-containing protein [Candidatus Lokiarchaeota archaeon]
MKYLCNDDQSNKFWEYKINGTSVTVKWGRVGLSGQSKVHNFSSSDDMQKFINKKVAEKMRKNYAPVDDKKLKEEVKTAQQLGHQYKISRMLFVNQKDNKLTHLAKYDPKKWVYVEILNSWKKDITRLLLSKNESYEITGGVTEGYKSITYGQKSPTSGNFVNAVRGILRRLSEQVVEVVKARITLSGARKLDMGGDEQEYATAALDALESMNITNMDKSVVSKFATMGTRVLDL